MVPQASDAAAFCVVAIVWRRFTVIPATLPRALDPEIGLADRLMSARSRVRPVAFPAPAEVRPYRTAWRLATRLPAGPDHYRHDRCHAVQNRIFEDWQHENGQALRVRRFVSWLGRWMGAYASRRIHEDNAARFLRKRLLVRSVPAYAGNTPSGAVGQTSSNGSFQHTRGTPGRAAGEWCERRFIPAYAGNARSPASPSSLRSVHPRIRGERGASSLTAPHSNGSSPHTRGTRYIIHEIPDPARFIPAYAGNAALRGGRSRATAVHPRIRGERGGCPGFGRQVGGSSPHTRGTRQHSRSSSFDPRFIPAYAGNASRSSRTRASDAVHPRIRGERSTNIKEGSGDAGSSPHTRGM